MNMTGKDNETANRTNIGNQQQAYGNNFLAGGREYDQATAHFSKDPCWNDGGGNPQQILARQAEAEKITADNALRTSNPQQLEGPQDTGLDQNESMWEPINKINWGQTQGQSEIADTCLQCTNLNKTPRLYTANSLPMSGKTETLTRNDSHTVRHGQKKAPKPPHKGTLKIATLNVKRGRI